MIDKRGVKTPPEWSDAISDNYEQSLDEKYMIELFDNMRLDMKCLCRK